MARAQGVLPPVQIARILAGEGVGQFSTNEYGQENGRSVPLSVALDYVGSILDDERTKIERLKVRNYTDVNIFWREGFRGLAFVCSLYLNIFLSVG